MDADRMRDASVLAKALMRDVVQPKRRTILENSANVALPVRDFANIAQLIELLANAG